MQKTSKCYLGCKHGVQGPSVTIVLHTVTPLGCIQKC